MLAKHRIRGLYMLLKTIFGRLMKFGTNFNHDITVLFCQIDDFCKEYESYLGQNLIGNTPVSGSGEGALSLS